MWWFYGQTKGANGALYIHADGCTPLNSTISKWPLDYTVSFYIN